MRATYHKVLAFSRPIPERTYGQEEDEEEEREEADLEEDRRALSCCPRGPTSLRRPRPARRRTRRRGARQAHDLSARLPLGEGHEADHGHRLLHARARRLPRARRNPHRIP